MRKRTARRSRPASLSNREIGTLPWSYLVVIAICGCVIAAGFLLAARQHFVSMDLGMKNSNLRKQLDDLESENRRLMLAREVALSPIEITRVARSFGFVESAEQTLAVPVTATASPKDGNAVAIKTVAITTKPSEPAGANVIKTSYHRPSAEQRVEAPRKAKAEKSANENKTQKNKSTKPEVTTIARR